MNVRHESSERLTGVRCVGCVVHQGNGHENDKRNGVFAEAGVGVFIMDMYNELIYPFDSRAARHIDCPVRLQHGVEDVEYLSKLTSHLTRSLDQFQPQLLVYNAGTDCLAGDSLGRMNVSAEGIVERDRIVFDMCLRRGIPIVMLLSGGYQQTNAAGQRNTRATCEACWHTPPTHRMSGGVFLTLFLLVRVCVVLSVIASSIANLQSSLHLWDVDPQLLAKRAKQEAKEQLQQQKEAVSNKRKRGKGKDAAAATHSNNNKHEAQDTERKEEPEL